MSEIIWKRQPGEHGSESVSEDGRFVIAKNMVAPFKGIGDANGLTQNGYKLTDTVSGYTSYNRATVGGAKADANRTVRAEKQQIEEGIVGWALPHQLGRDWPIGATSLRMLMADGTQQEGRTLIPVRGNRGNLAERAEGIREHMAAWQAHYGLNIPEVF